MHDHYKHPDKPGRVTVAGKPSDTLVAVILLRDAQLGSAYEDAWDSWSSSGDSEIWDAALADGLDR